MKQRAVIDLPVDDRGAVGIRFSVSSATRKEWAAALSDRAACGSSRPALHAVARSMAEQVSKAAARRMWKAVENLCLWNTSAVVSAVFTVSYVYVDNSGLQPRTGLWLQSKSLLVGPTIASRRRSKSSAL